MTRTSTSSEGQIVTSIPNPAKKVPAEMPLVAIQRFGFLMAAATFVAVMVAFAIELFAYCSFDLRRLERSSLGAPDQIGLSCQFSLAVLDIWALLFLVGGLMLIIGAIASSRLHHWYGVVLEGVVVQKYFSVSTSNNFYYLVVEGPTRSGEIRTQMKLTDSVIYHSTEINSTYR